MIYCSWSGRGLAIAQNSFGRVLAGRGKQHKYVFVHFDLFIKCCAGEKGKAMVLAMKWVQAERKKVAK